ncbi:MAG: GCD complex subunit gcd7 [Watsoniomyces obsoletus]|nr:MAG: GCD complex subunit gcd7 [Watsoniomyces obsoletus]
MERHDCISISESIISPTLFHSIESGISDRDKQHSIHASEFEKLTATAFECFLEEKIDVAVVETGMGGSLDATNVLRHDEVLVTLVTKVGWDHQSWLGNTLEEIAGHKAGICKFGVPCLVDSTNEMVVLDVLEDVAKRKGAGEVVGVPPSSSSSSSSSEEVRDVWNAVNQEGEDMEEHQKVNLALAILASKLALERLKIKRKSSEGGIVQKRGREKQKWEDEGFDVKEAVKTAKNVKFPGRLQWLSIENITGRKKEVLLDGAHNGQSAGVLGGYIDRKIRGVVSSPSSPSSSSGSQNTSAERGREEEQMITKEASTKEIKGKGKGKENKKKVTFILAATHGKNLSELFTPILRKGDWVVVVEFSSVEGMPWIKPSSTKDLIDVIQPIISRSSSSPGRSSSRGDGVKREEEEEEEEGEGLIIDAKKDIREALNLATNLAGDEGPMVIAGSLYLVGDILRILRDEE